MHSTPTTGSPSHAGDERDAGRNHRRAVDRGQARDQVRNQARREVGASLDETREYLYKLETCLNLSPRCGGLSIALFRRDDVEPKSPHI